MSRPILWASAAVALASQAYGADRTDTPFTVIGSAPRICAVSDPVLTSGALMNFQSLNGTSLQISELADPKTLATNAAQATVSFNAVCDYPHQVILESQNAGLYRGGGVASAPPRGFADGVPYSVQLAWGPVVHRLFVPATTRQVVQDRVVAPQAIAGTLQLQISIQAGASNLTANAPLIAGDYSDTLRVTLEPQ